MIFSSFMKTVAIIVNTIITNTIITNTIIIFTTINLEISTFLLTFAEK